MKKDNIFGLFQKNMEKCRKKVKKDEKGSDFAAKGPN